MNGGWETVGLFLVVFHLRGCRCRAWRALERSLKRRRGLWFGSLLGFLFIGASSYIYWHIEPASHLTFHLSWVFFAIIAGMGGLWMAYFFHKSEESQSLLGGERAADLETSGAGA